MTRTSFWKWLLGFGLGLGLMDFSRAAEGPNHRLRHLSVDQGLPQASVLALAQTPDGFLWLGTQEGLVRWDGHRLQILDRKQVPALGDNYIKHLSATPKGALWVATEGSGLLRFHPEHRHASRPVSGLPGETLQALLSEGDEDVWVGTQKGLVRVSGSGVVAPPSLEADVTALCRDAGGTVWTGTGDGQLYRGGLSGFTVVSVPFKGRISTLVPAPGGGIWIGFFSGQVFRWGGTQAEPLSASRVEGNLRCLAVDAQDRLWAGTGKGLWQLHEEHWVPFGALKDEEIPTMLQDREGTLWVGTLGDGATQVRTPFFEGLPEQHLLPKAFALSLLKDPDGSLWMGTRGEGVVQVLPGQVRRWGTAEGLPHGAVHALARDPEGVLWAGTGRGLAQFHGTRFREVSLEGAPSRRITCLMAEASGTLWIGTAQGLLQRQGGRILQPEFYAAHQGKPVLAIHRDRSGLLWVGTGGTGVFVFEGERLVASWPKAGEPATVWWIHETQSGDLWFATYERGLVWYHQGVFRTVGAAQGLLDDLGFYVLEDHAGRFWMGCNRGIWSFSRRDAEACMLGLMPRIPIDRYDREDGLPTPEGVGGTHHVACKDAAGKFWVTTIQGPVGFDPKRLHARVGGLHPRVEQARVDGQSLAVPGTLRLAPGSHRLELAFTAAALESPQRLAFQYRLEPLDRDWNDAGLDRKVAYPPLAPGTYTFRVRVREGTAMAWVEAAPWSITQAPRFVQTHGFMLLMIGSIGGLLVGGHRMRVRALKAREAWLSQQVAERTHSLQEANTQLEAALRAAEEARATAQDADRLKTELLSIAAHDLKNPLQGIQGYADLLRLEPLREGELAYAADQIDASSRHMLGLIEGFLTAARLDEPTLKLRGARVDLLEPVLASLARNGVAAEAKGQRLLLEARESCPVWGDVHWLEEIADNLVSNAVKYAPKNTVIHLRVTRTYDQARLEVQDEGPGLTAEDLQHLFQRFRRLSARPTGGEASSGLGLAIVKRLVELHHGHIWAESSPGTGATFVVTLPMAAEDLAGCQKNTDS